MSELHMSDEQIAHRDFMESLMDKMYEAYREFGEGSPECERARAEYNQHADNGRDDWPCFITDPATYSFLSDYHKDIHGFRYRGWCSAKRAKELIEELKREAERQQAAGVEGW